MFLMKIRTVPIFRTEIALAVLIFLAEAVFTILVFFSEVGLICTDICLLYQCLAGGRALLGVTLRIAALSPVSIQTAATTQGTVGAPIVLGLLWHQQLSV
jgi:hypothetical protein